MRLRFTILLLFFSCLLMAVDYDMLIDIDADNIENADAEVEDMKERLSYLASNPINLNCATRQQLENLPFLNINQIENLMEYIFDYGYMQTVYEIALVPGFDAQTIRFMLPFIVVEPVEEVHRYSFKNIFKYGKSQFTLKAGGTFQKRKGYTNGKYLGDPYSLSFKYYFKHSDFSICMLGSKSEGEPFDFKYNKGFDFYSGHIAFFNISDHVKYVIAGDYRAVFGQGLVFKANSSFSNYSFGSNIISADKVNPSFSNSETGYLRGLAAGFGGKNYNFNFMVSHTQYNKDEGYHRTVSDFEKRYKTPSYLLGGNFSFSGKYYKVGFSGYYDFYDKWFNIGADYRFKVKRFSFAGEVAFDRYFNFGTINTLSVLCSDNVTFNAIFRHYGKNFKSKFGNAYSRNSLSDETGLYMAFDASPFRNWKLSFFSDVYSTCKPSVGFNIGVKALYSPSDNNAGYIKYVVTSKPKSSGSLNSVKQYKTYYKHCFTFNYSVTFSNNVTVKSTMAASGYKLDSLKTTFGYFLGFNLSWGERRRIFSFTVGGAFFDIPVYDNVIYSYEPTILYGYSQGQYYGIGCRGYVILKVNPIRNMAINIKVSDTWFKDRDKIGSGNDEIMGSHKTEIQAIFNYKF